MGPGTKKDRLVYLHLKLTNERDDLDHFLDAWYVGGHVKTYKNEQKPGFATAAYFEIGLPADSNASLYRRYCM